MKRRALWIEEPGRAQVREETAPAPEAGEISVRVLLSALSAGTERMFFEGRVPSGTQVDPNLPAHDARLDYPLKYGYAAVGIVDQVGSAVDADWQGQQVFAFHPHESRFNCPPDQVVPLPSDLPLQDAVFLANVETAVSLLLDAAPLIGERVVVHGQGVVGLLTTALLAELPLDQLIAVEPARNRRELAQSLGAKAALDPGVAQPEQQLRALLSETEADGADLSFELSGSSQALNLALATTGFTGRIVVGAWYGEAPLNVQLGERFHRGRVHLISSQVSTLDPRLRGRWSKARRLQVALAALRRLQPSRLISHRVPIERAADAYALLGKPDESVQVVISYGESTGE